MRWTDSDNLNARDALVVGGPNDGLRVSVNDSVKGLRYPDVIDMTGYRFDRERWEFIYEWHPRPYPLGDLRYENEGEIRPNDRQGISGEPA